MGLAPILVVYDESEMRSALSHALTRDGFAVQTAASGTEALVKIKKEARGKIFKKGVWLLVFSHHHENYCNNSYYY